MFLKKIKPQISVCIPVFNSEKYLANCLESLNHLFIPEGFKPAAFAEIIIVNDGSTGTDSQNRSAKQIVSPFKKNSVFPVKFISHEENKGLVEARRTAVYEARGKYIFILDSDDSLPENALKTLYEKAIETEADIVHGRANVYFSDSFEKALENDKESLELRKKDMEKKVQNVFEGELLDKDIFEGYLVNHNHLGFLWGKLITKETWLNAYEHIGPVFCILAEDFLQYFWLCYEAKKYTGINEIVYNYSINTGITSRSLITDIYKWEKVCSTASVFTSIYSEVEEKNISLSDEQKINLVAKCRYHLYDNLLQLKQAVSPELQVQAREMLEDYWGKSFVEAVEKEFKM